MTEPIQSAPAASSARAHLAARTKILIVAAEVLLASTAAGKTLIFGRDLGLFARDEKNSAQ